MSTQSSQGNLLFLADDLLRTLISFLGVDMASIRLCLENWHQAGKSILKENIILQTRELYEYSREVGSWCS